MLFRSIACGDSGGNLVGRRDYSSLRDAADPGGETAGPDVDRDVAIEDPAAPDLAPPWDPGEDPGADDPGTPQDPGANDPGTPDPGMPDPGTDPGAPSVRLVTDQQALSTLNSLIAGARTSVQMVELEFIPGWAPDQVGAALAAAVNRGVAVKVLLESDVDKNSTRLDSLRAAGIDAKLDGASKTLHTKLLVVDRSRALVGSTNLSTSSLNYNHEANVALDGAAIVAPFAGYADALWSSPSKAASMTSAQVAGVAPIGDGQYRDRVVPMLRAASRRALLVLYHLSDDWGGDAGDLAYELIDAKGRGVDVRVVLESSAYETYVNDQNGTSGGNLSSDGVQVRYHAAETLTHAKLLVVDDSVVVHSGNWVASGLGSNHEAGTVVQAATVTADAAAYFEKVWNESVP